MESRAAEPASQPSPERQLAGRFNLGLGVKCQAQPQHNINNDDNNNDNAMTTIMTTIMNDDDDDSDDDDDDDDDDDYLDSITLVQPQSSLSGSSHVLPGHHHPCCQCRQCCQSPPHRHRARSFSIPTTAQSQTVNNRQQASLCQIRAAQIKFNIQ
jgi:hypothetical protein